MNKWMGKQIHFRRMIVCEIKELPHRYYIIQVLHWKIARMKKVKKHQIYKIKFVNEKISKS